MATKDRRIRTLLYGDERLSAGEIDLLHTPALQRLYDLHQLGLTDRIFIDASHSRLHHVVGVLEQTEKLVAAIISNLDASPGRAFLTAQAGKFQAGEFSRDVEEAKPVIRLIGLLHDLTHAPYGHTIEDEIRLVACKHDEPIRQSEAFYALVCQYLGWLLLEAGVRPVLDGRGKPNRGELVIPEELWQYLESPGSSPPKTLKEIAEAAGTLLKNPTPGALAAWQRSRGGEEIGELLAQLSCAMRALLYLDVLHAERISEANCPDEKPYLFEQLISETLSFAGMERFLTKYRFVKHRDAYMLDIIGNTVCADLLDYAQRDAHFAGIKLGYDADRIAENFTLVTWDLGREGRPRAADHASVKSSRNLTDPFKGKSLRTAISLYSHKLRTDVASELMNLLNVRFYIYERALFHPTKCAAGAMLGTALQLIGWRPLRDDEKVSEYELPKEFRNVGDAVFLHDLTGGAKMALFVLGANSGMPALQIKRDRNQLNELYCSQARIAELILKRWEGLPLAEAEECIRAGLELLSRVMARRFYKPVFRNLPNSKNTILRKKPEQLAETFKDPVVRFRAERDIEKKAGLRPGSVVIHCPRRITAQKVANVLLVFPTGDGKGESPTKLRNIKELDQDVFGAHEEAIQAVERMYGSMWRLVVYVVPEALANYPAVTASAGKVIFDTMDEDHSYPEEKGWENDSYLATELEQKFGSIVPRPALEGAESLDEGARAVEPAAVTISSERPLATPPGEILVEEILVATTDGDHITVRAAREQKWVMTVRKAWRTNVTEEAPKLVDFYDSDLQDLTDQKFEELLKQIEREYGAVPKNRRSMKLEDFLAQVAEMIARDSGPLFGKV
jgi:HD superfamily phosphohydrolase